MNTIKFCLTFAILVLVFPSRCTAKENNRPKRILLDDNYYTIVNKLDNLTKKVESLEAENAVLNKQMEKLNTLSNEVETLKSNNALLTQHVHNSKLKFNYDFGKIKYETQYKNSITLFLL